MNSNPSDWTPVRSDDYKYLLINIAKSNSTTLELTTRRSSSEAIHAICHPPHQHYQPILNTFSNITSSWGWVCPVATPPGHMKLHPHNNVAQVQIRIFPQELYSKTPEHDRDKCSLQSHRQRNWLGEKYGLLSWSLWRFELWLLFFSRCSRSQLPVYCSCEDIMLENLFFRSWI